MMQQRQQVMVCHVSTEMVTLMYKSHILKSMKCHIFQLCTKKHGHFSTCYSFKISTNQYISTIFKLLDVYNTTIKLMISYGCKVLFGVTDLL